MSTGLAAGQANIALEAIRADGPFIQLHIGDPGAAGTANKATELTRKAVTFAAASGGAMSNSVAVTFANIAGSQDATHFSLWRGSGADTDGTGTFCFSGTIAANSYTAGDTYTAAIGDIDLALPGAA